MTNIHKKIILVAIILLIGLLILGMLLMRENRIGQQSLVKVPPPQPSTASFKRDPYLDQFALKDAPPSSQVLTPQEQKYAIGLPQKFPNTPSAAEGTLVVTADMADVRIIITTKDPGDADLSNQTQYNAPANIAPVRMVLPANYYTIVAEKDQYIWKWIPIVIEQNKVTRLQVHLDPANLQN